eukprot:37005-Eustigmatos_ZCMA.PRE.1
MQLCETSAKTLAHEEDMCQAYTNAWSDATADNMRIRELTLELLKEKMPKGLRPVHMRQCYVLAVSQLRQG